MGQFQQQDIALIATTSIDQDATQVVHPWKEPSWIQRKLSGWRFGVVSCAASSVLVFLINLVLLIWAESRNNFSSSDHDGKMPLYDGDCEVVRKLNIGAHLLINILSTLLLGASNYCMQCMSAPTRKEVDKAHSKGSFVDIGVQSVRNMNKISEKRMTLYLLLGLSSLPLHLFYNSTVFSSIAANDYYVYSVNEAFTNPKTTDFVGFHYPDCKGDYFGGCNLTQISADRISKQLFEQARTGLMEKLEPLECLNAYAQIFQTGRGSLLLVSESDADGFSTDTAMLKWELGEMMATGATTQCPPYTWICGDSNCGNPCQYRLGGFRKDISTWRPFQKDISYCLAERIEQHCRLLYSSGLLITVIVLNAFKVAIMLYLAFGILETPLMTIGDAISSFLQRPDPTTEGMCLAAKRDFRRQEQLSRDFSTLTDPKQYKSEPKSRSKGASTSRWIISMFFLFAAILIVFVLLIWGVSAMSGRNDLSTIFALGLGAINPATFIRWSLPTSGKTAIITNVLVANSPQVILSLIYFSYNSIFTCMSLAMEWSRFAVSSKQQKPLQFPSFLNPFSIPNSRRDKFQQEHQQHLLLQNSNLLKQGKDKGKGLRVTTVPHGFQRSTYFLQLPYRYGLPLLLTSGILHWLVSQSIFVVNVEAYMVIRHEERTHSTDNDYMTCGYSPLAMLIVILVGLIMIVYAWICGRRKLASGMPVVRSCSRAIAAACHQGFGTLNETSSDNSSGVGKPGNDTIVEVESATAAYPAREIAYSKVTWGVVPTGSSNEIDSGGSQQQQQQRGTIERPGHCCITDKEILEPVDGAYYS